MTNTKKITKTKKKDNAKDNDKWMISPEEFEWKSCHILEGLYTSL